MNSKKDLALSILSKNPGTLLSGSIALSLQGYRTEREHGDIDIYLPPDKWDGAQLIEGVIKINEESDQYEDKDSRKTFEYNGIKVELFTSERVLKTVPLDGGYTLIAAEEILLYKLRFALQRATNYEKHRDDLKYILNNL